jgi:hypothetical protein
VISRISSFLFGCLTSISNGKLLILTAQRKVRGGSAFSGEKVEDTFKHRARSKGPFTLSVEYPDMPASLK